MFFFLLSPAKNMYKYFWKFSELLGAVCLYSVCQIWGFQQLISASTIAGIFCSLFWLTIYRYIYTCTYMYPFWWNLWLSTYILFVELLLDVLDSPTLLHEFLRLCSFFFSLVPVCSLKIVSCLVICLHTPYSFCCHLWSAIKPIWYIFNFNYYKSHFQNFLWVSISLLRFPVFGPSTTMFFFSKFLIVYVQLL